MPPVADLLITMDDAQFSYMTKRQSHMLQPLLSGH